MLEADPLLLLPGFNPGVKGIPKKGSVFFAIIAGFLNPA
jgi:hypothetical protein